MTTENPGQAGGRPPAAHRDPSPPRDGAVQRETGEPRNTGAHRDATVHRDGSPWRGDRRPGEAAGQPGVATRTRPAPDPAGRPARRDLRREGRSQVAARTRASRPRTRRAHLRMARIDPWSAMKVTFMLSIAIAVVFVVAVVVLWSALSAAGVFATINEAVRNQATFGQTAQKFDVLAYVGLNRVLGVTLLLAVVNVVLWTALTTLFSFVYNLTAGLLGGIEVTLAETE